METRSLLDNWRRVNYGSRRSIDYGTYVISVWGRVKITVFGIGPVELLPRSEGLAIHVQEVIVLEVFGVGLEIL